MKNIKKYQKNALIVEAYPEAQGSRTGTLSTGYELNTIQLPYRKGTDERGVVSVALHRKVTGGD